MLSPARDKDADRFGSMPRADVTNLHGSGRRMIADVAVRALGG